MARLRIRLVRSVIGRELKQRRTVKALGLTRMHQSVEKEDTPTMRGMIHKVRHMVQVELVEGEIVSMENAKVRGE